MVRGLLTLLTFVVSTTVLGLTAIVVGLATGRREFVFRLGRTWARLHLYVMGVRPEYVGAEHARGDGARIFLANHLSTLDIWAVVPALPDSTRFVAKRSLFWIPVLGQAMAVAGFIPIHRADRKRAVRSLDRATERVRRGESVILFPEGTRSRDGKLGPFKRGAFHLAMDSGAPIVPVSISGTGKVVRPRSIVVRPGPVRITFAPVVDPTAFKRGDIDGLSEHVRTAIASGLEPDEL